MKLKKIRCQVCGTHNWSFAEYCQRCSGALYEEEDLARDNYPPNDLLK